MGHKENAKKQTATAFILALIVVLALALILCFLAGCMKGFKPTSVTTEIVETEVTATEIPETALSYPGTLFTDEFKKAKAKTDYSMSLKSTKILTDSESLSIVTDKTAVVPVNYTMMVFPMLPYPVYGFVNSRNQTEYRVYAMKESQGSVTYGMLKAIPVMKGTQISFDIDESTEPLQPADEKFGNIIVKDAPANRTYGLEKVYGRTGVYQINSTENGAPVYVCYGNYEGWDEGFFLADSSGKPYPGIFRLDTDKLKN